LALANTRVFVVPILARRLLGGGEFASRQELGCGCQKVGRGS
jgi:hypothetical protein